jgi:hypothetical protein
MIQPREILRQIGYTIQCRPWILAYRWRRGEAAGKWCRQRAQAWRQARDHFLSTGSPKARRLLHKIHDRLSR